MSPTKVQLIEDNAVTTKQIANLNVDTADIAKGAVTSDKIASDAVISNATSSSSCSGNSATVTNGVYTTGDQSIGGNKTFTNTIAGSINGNAATVTNGVYTTNFTGSNQYAGYVGGYQKLPGGMIMQWGYFDNSIRETKRTISFPIEFLNACFNVQITEYRQNAISGISLGPGISIFPTKTSVTFNVSNYPSAYFWFAIGL